MILLNGIQVTFKDLQKGNMALARGDYDAIYSLGNHIRDMNGSDEVNMIGVSLSKAAQEESFNDVRRWLAELSVALGCR